MLGARGRAVAVAILSLLFPGLGQAVLRRWVRALLFAGLFVGTFAIFAPEGAFAAQPGVDAVLETAREVNEGLSTVGTIALTVVQFAAMMDAYVQALRETTTTEGPTCPRCGREVNPLHGFCQWCTYEFEDPTE